MIERNKERLPGKNPKDAPSTLEIKGSNIKRRKLKNNKNVDNVDNA